MINQGKIESFWRGPGGVSLLGSGGVLALLAFGGDSSEPVSSPFLSGWLTSCLVTDFTSRRGFSPH